MSTFRILKIYPKSRTRTWDNIRVPEIRLEGKWLEDAGFEAGNNVVVQIDRRKLIITLLKDE